MGLSEQQCLKKTISKERREARSKYGAVSGDRKSNPGHPSGKKTRLRTRDRLT
jgi:hypothetical protein